MGHNSHHNHPLGFIEQPVRFSCSGILNGAIVVILIACFLNQSSPLPTIAVLFCSLCSSFLVAPSLWTVQKLSYSIPFLWIFQGGVRTRDKSDWAVRPHPIGPVHLYAAVPSAVHPGTRARRPVSVSRHHGPQQQPDVREDHAAVYWAGGNRGRFR